MGDQKKTPCLSFLNAVWFYRGNLHCQFTGYHRFLPASEGARRRPSSSAGKDCAQNTTSYSVRRLYFQQTLHT